MYLFDFTSELKMDASELQDIIDLLDNKVSDKSTKEKPENLTLNEDSLVQSIEDSLADLIENEDQDEIVDENELDQEETREETQEDEVLFVSETTPAVNNNPMGHKPYSSLNSLPIVTVNGGHNYSGLLYLIVSKNGGLRPTVNNKQNTISENLSVNLDLDNDDVSFVSESRLTSTVESRDCNKCRCSSCIISTYSPYNCRYCNFQSRSSSCGKLHEEKTHENRKPFACYFCPYRADCRMYLNKHMKIHKQKIAYRCSICDYEIDNKLSYDNHLKSHNTEKYHMKCPHCDYRTSHKGTLKTHIRVHTNEKPYECYTCGFKTSMRQSMIGHIQTHNRKKIYKCQDCNYSSITEGACKRHARRKNHSVDRSSDEIRCDKCSFVAYTERAMHWHSWVHTNQKLFECLECEYKSNSSSNFHKHQAVHTKD